MARQDLTAISRTLSRALRHEPWLYELELDAEGWTPVEVALGRCVPSGASGRISRSTTSPR